jgi:hypothetical protein
MSADEVMVNILHLVENMEEDLPNSDLSASHGSGTPIASSAATDRGYHGGRRYNNRGGRGGRGLPNKCSACGSQDHILSQSCTTSDDALMKWTLAKRKISTKIMAPLAAMPKRTLPS